MDLLWPGFLTLLILVPLLLAIYLWMLRRRKAAVRYSSISLIRAALPAQNRWRRHVPFAAFLFSLSSLVFAIGRPVSIVSVPANQTTVMLTLDVSGSMCQTDILPSRLEAAEAATIEFIQRQDNKTQIGIVAFAGFAELVQPPTKDQEQLLAVMRSLITARGTNIGGGILEAIDAISDIDPNVAPLVNDASPVATPVPEGAYVPAIIVVLTDGVATEGPYPLDAAQEAANRGIRVYTIGFGTANPPGRGFGDCGGRFRGGFGGGFGGGGPGPGFRRGIDEAMLTEIAEMTGGEYYPAESGSDLQEVFDSLPTQLIVKHEVTEVSVFFVAAGALFAMLALAFALLWHPLP